jgi:predicted nuclease of predicted toxin-antitoxin system
MRVLLDEQLDRRLKHAFDAAFDVWTVADCGWKGKKNGELLRAAQQDFDVLITMDKGIEHQQKWSTMDLGFVIVLAKTNRYVDILPLMPQLNAVLHHIQAGQLVHVSHPPISP